MVVAKLVIKDLKFLAANVLRLQESKEKLFVFMIVKSVLQDLKKLTTNAPLLTVKRVN